MQQQSLIDVEFYLEAQGRCSHFIYQWIFNPPTHYYRGELVVSGQVI